MKRTFEIDEMSFLDSMRIVYFFCMHHAPLPHAREFGSSSSFCECKADYTSLCDGVLDFLSPVLLIHRFSKQMLDYCFGVLLSTFALIDQIYFTHSLEYTPSFQVGYFFQCGL